MPTTTSIPMPNTASTRGFDARVQLVLLIAVVVASMTSVRSPAGMLLLWAFALLWHVLAARHTQATRRVLTRVAPLMIVVVVLNAVFVPGEAIVTLGGVRLASREGFDDGVFFALRLGVMLTALSAFLAGTTPERLARGIHDLLRRISGRAAREAAFFLFISMSFVPLFADELTRIRNAQSFRGANFSGSLWRRIASVRAWLVPLVLSAVHRSGQLSLAVELRDTRNRLVHSLEPPHARGADALLALTGVLVLVAASLAR